ncbi:hypothetical protein MAPG_06400 [Magnaporthiopsis poae ATCC 64411]|uniref:DUF1760-domain-containing protein n=1 Tax=Magnaporthiopsis poae (strain ATCC 64411 / 73-15) TaxID=644358 RepID=A0A0C4E1X6_MAGP6|nr:hypothetical protein MAPG_06400 [Magnaporthiopsis poae ATCC 64411]
MAATEAPTATETDKAITALLESRPPATDNFTYLTIVEKFLRPEVLPTLNEVLQDASLTQEIGWDLVQNLVSIPGSDQCLETIARLGNPREVIVKCLEVLEGYPGDAERDGSVEEEEAETAGQEEVEEAAEEGQSRRHHHRKDDDDAAERLLLSFVLSVLEAYVNARPPSWAERLVESYAPQRIVPGKRSALQAFKEEQDLLARDTIVGQLAALCRDLGVRTDSPSFISTVCKEPIYRRTLPDADDLKGAQDIHLPTGGAVCLLAYSLFSSTVFGANVANPDMRLFPDHFALLQRHIEDDAHAQIQATPGTIEAIVAVGLWLQHNGRTLPPTPSASEDDESATPAFMPYHHLLTLCSVYHPSLGVRNAASTLAGQVLHADPDDEDRLRILEDLLENCMFSNLKACAVTWLREELAAALDAKTTTTTSTSRSPFAGPEAVEHLQYLVFPDMQFAREMDRDAFVEYFLQNAPFILQSVNFAILLFRSADDHFGRLAPPGMRAAVEERYVRPLLAAVAAFEEEGGKAPGDDDDHAVAHVAMEVSILGASLRRLTAP